MSKDAPRSALEIGTGQNPIKYMRKKATKQNVIMDYIKGKLNISEVRKLLNRIEGQRLVNIYDKKSIKTEKQGIIYYYIL